MAKKIAIINQANAEYFNYYYVNDVDFNKIRKLCEFTQDSKKLSDLIIKKLQYLEDLMCNKFEIKVINDENYVDILDEYLDSSVEILSTIENSAVKIGGNLEKNTYYRRGLLKIIEAKFAKIDKGFMYKSSYFFDEENIFERFAKTFDGYYPYFTYDVTSKKDLLYLHSEIVGTLGSFLESAQRSISYNAANDTAIHSEFIETIASIRSTGEFIDVWNKLEKDKLKYFSDIGFKNLKLDFEETIDKIDAIEDKLRYFLASYAKRSDVDATFVKTMTNKEDVKYKEFLSMINNQPNKVKNMFEMAKNNDENPVVQPKKKVTTKKALTEKKIFDFNEIFKDIIGQEKALEIIKNLVENIDLFEAPNKPLANLFFTGPSGVGKTEVAQQIAKFVYGGGKEDTYKVDMAQMHSDAEINSIVGSPDGYIGSDKTPSLLEFYKKHPDGGLILLDEFEKACPEVKKLFLNILDKAEMNIKGKNCNFSKYIIIATSNAVQEVKNGSMGFNAKEPTEKETNENYKNELVKSGLPTELVGRFAIVPFEQLKKEHGAKIAEIMIRNFMDTFKTNYNTKFNKQIEIFVEPAVYNFIGELADMKKTGARAIADIINIKVRPILVQKLRGIKNDFVTIKVTDFEGKENPTNVEKKQAE